MNLNSIKAVIFDLDGVLVNTVESHFVAWCSIAQYLGVRFTRLDNDDLRGVPRAAALERLIERSNYPCLQEGDYLLRRKSEVYLKDVLQKGEGIRMPHSEELITFLQARSIQVAIASASRNANTLLKLANLSSLFDVVSDGNFQGKGKPNPEQLLEVSNKLNVQPGWCLVLEDSRAGILAAKSAGMRSIAVGTHTSPGSEGRAENLSQLLGHLKKDERTESNSLSFEY